MKKILIVDDVKDTTDLVKLILESSGYNCTTVNSGRESLELIRNNKFDLILLDLTMPEVTGVDVLKKLKDEGTVGDSKVVLFTASPTFTDTYIEDLKKQYGVLDRIRKPFTKRELLDVITRNLA